MNQPPPDSPFSKLIESAGCMIVILRADLSIAYFNPYSETLTEYTADQMQSASFMESLIPEAERVRVRANLENMISRESGIHGFEEAIVRKDGQLRWLEWNAEFLEDYQGSPGLVLVGHNVTARKEVEKELQNREARLQAVLNTAVDGIVTIDKRGLVQSMNVAAETIFGYSEKEVLGKNVSMLMPSPYRDEHDQYLRNYQTTRRPKIIGIGREVEGRKKDGRVFPCYLAVSEVPAEGDQLFTGIIRDLTEQRAAETRVLQSERLAAIGETVAGLAHESRNAFQRSQACLEMLALELEGRADELELVERIQSAMNHLHHLYEEVRDYAAPIKLDVQNCNIAHVWRDAWAHLEVSRGGRQLEFSENLGDVDPHCDVDWFAMGQVFRNILENAIDACPDPGAIVISMTDAALDGRAALEIRVTDSGPGFSLESRDKIFDAFFTTKTKGTGLGMAITRRIVEAHHGRLAIGEPGQSGGQIVITLPRHPGENRADVHTAEQ